MDKFFAERGVRFYEAPLIVEGKVTSGRGVASENLEEFHSVIEKRIGLNRLMRGTLNVKIDDDYFVRPDACLTSHEYTYDEAIYFQRCKINGVKSLIMRPDTHEKGGTHGPSCLEIMSDRNLRKHLGLQDGDLVNVEVEGEDG